MTQGTQFAGERGATVSVQPHLTCRPARRRGLRAVTITAIGLCVTAASWAHLAHEDREHFVSALPWTFEGWELTCLALSAGLYALGLLRLWRHAGALRGIGSAPVVAFFAGWLAVIAALVSPLDAMGAELFSAHMVQHEMLMIVAAPLLVLGRPLAVWVWALPKVCRRPLGGFFHHPAWRAPWLLITAPFWAWSLHALALWLWHLPALFDAALRSETVHTWQHLSFLLTALLFWWSVFGGATRRERGVALVSLFTTMVHTGALGALLTLSSVVWYTAYLHSAPAWGLSALQDQQLGGVVMWVPAGIVYIVCGLWLAGRWLAEEPRSALVA